MLAWTPVLLAPRLSAYARSLIKLSAYQLEAIIGMLLSDAWLEKRSLASNVRLGIAQAKAKAGYLEMLYTLLAGLFAEGHTPYAKSSVRKGYDTMTHSVTLLTMALPCLNELFTLFYSEGNKVVPLNIFQLMTEVSLAHWIMGDGSKHGVGLHLNVYCFSVEGVQLLMHTLTAKFGLTCTIHDHSKGPRIYVHAISMPHLRSLVLPHMVPSMHYKLGL